MERNVARLFRDRVKLTAAVEFTQASILAGVSTLCLSCLHHSTCPAPYTMLQPLNEFYPLLSRWVVSLNLDATTDCLALSTVVVSVCEMHGAVQTADVSLP